MSRNYKLNVVKFNGIKRNFGFPDDYLIRLLPKYPEMFKVVSYGNKRNSMEIELVSWDSKLGVSVVESRGLEIGEGPRFTCLLPSTWVKGLERFREFNENVPYISPYKLDCDGNEFVEESEEAEKRAVGVVHELLSLTLWKKMSIMKLSRFSREFNLPKKLNGLLLKHPGIFYVTNKYQIHTVMLREGYNGSDLCVKDPLVVVKDKFGALMQEGLHEYRLRRTDLNLERKKKKGMDFVRPVKRVKSSVSDDSEKDDDRVGGKRGGILSDPEERKRFYKVLFEDEVPKD
ncbi:hypothetical protein GIB67_008809 [Kingdonia uniflora]|uniref:PORR domain-containing protein n=1 Tax=Kingdonia uniflora TaxID=39325 RepID=A0A7J7LY90_9MAGN|nr:hypothetical protein GIB67_008809 [Kingdonia uniflora]